MFGGGRCARVVRTARRGGAFVRVMAEWGEAECEEWLLGEKTVSGRTLVCPPDVKDIWLDGFKDDIWDEGDVPAESSPLSARDEKVPTGDSRGVRREAK